MQLIAAHKIHNQSFEITDGISVGKKWVIKTDFQDVRKGFCDFFFIYLHKPKSVTSKVDFHFDLDIAVFNYTRILEHCDRLLNVQAMNVLFTKWHHFYYH